MAHFKLTHQITGAVEFVSTSGTNAPDQEGVATEGYDVAEISRPPEEHEELVGGKLVKNALKKAEADRAAALQMMTRVQFMDEVMRLVDEKIAAKGKGIGNV